MSVPVSARRDSSNCVYSIAPDVCWTPIGDVIVPVAYNSICFFAEGQTSRTSRTVRNNGNHDFQLNTRCTRTEGHDAGTRKGVIVPGHQEVSHVMTGEGTIYSEGWAIVRDGDPAWINRPDEGAVEDRRSSSKQKITHA